MQTNQLANGRGRQSLQETAQRGGIWKLLQADQRQKQSIVLENLGLVDALDAGDQHIEKDQDQILGTIAYPRWRGLEDALEPPAETKLVTKPLN